MSFQLNNEQNTQNNPFFSFVSESQLEEIHLATLEVMEQTGMRVDHSEARQLLKGAGCRVDGDRVYFPGWLVEECIRSAPSAISIFNREGKRALQLAGSNTYFGTGSDLPNIIDLETGKRRKGKKSDVEYAARLLEELDGFDFIMSYSLVNDYLSPAAYLHQFEAMVANTGKPIVYTVDSVRNNELILEMAALVAGDKEKLAHRPFILLYSEPISPLVHTEEGVEKMFQCLEWGVPVVYTPGVVAGGTTPVTRAGTIVQMNAESLAGVVMAQLKRKGAPVVIGGGATPMDMMTTACLYGAPEAKMNYAVMTRLAQFYDLPNFTEAGCTDAPLADLQAGMEAGMGVLLAQLSGANLVHDVGYLDGGKTGYLPFLLICNEFISWARYFNQGTETDEERLAVDVIEEVGPGGHFLQTAHTSKFFKQEIWRSELFNRDMWDNWQSQGSKTCQDKAREKTIALLENCEENLEGDKREALRELIEREEAALKNK